MRGNPNPRNSTQKGLILKKINEKKMKKIEKAYKEIFDVLEKYNDICGICYDLYSIKTNSKKHLFLLYLNELGYNINTQLCFNDFYCIEHINIGKFISISKYGGDTNRTISYEADGKEPNDEFLLAISFSTGAYIFSEDYPKEYFQMFFDELQTYNPDYKDIANSSLYWKIENGVEIFSKFHSILDKYKQEYNEYAKKEKIKNLEKRLNELKNEK